jgi:hypothetical protein
MGLFMFIDGWDLVFFLFEFFFIPFSLKFVLFFFAHLVTVQNGCLRGVILFNLVFGIVYFLKCLDLNFDIVSEYISRLQFSLQMFYDWLVFEVSVC